MIDLERPLVFLDLEATGTDPDTDRIIQIAGTRFNGAGQQVGELSTLVCPERPVPEKILDLTGIEEENILTAPNFEDGPAHETLRLIAGADVCGHNLENYDWPLLEAEMKRCRVAAAEGIMDEPRRLIDTMEIERALSSLSLEALCRKYTGKELEEAHNAEADVQALQETLSGLLDYHEVTLEEALDETPEFLDPEGKLELDDGNVLFRFGKYKYDTLSEVTEKDPQYVEWMLDSAYENLGQYIEPHLPESFRDQYR